MRSFLPQSRRRSSHRVGNSSSLCFEKRNLKLEEINRRFKHRGALPAADQHGEFVGRTVHVAMILGAEFVED